MRDRAARSMSAARYQHLRTDRPAESGPRGFGRADRGQIRTCATWPASTAARSCCSPGRAMSLPDRPGSSMTVTGPRSGAPHRPSACPPAPQWRSPRRLARPSTPGSTPRSARLFPFRRPFSALAFASRKPIAKRSKTKTLDSAILNRPAEPGLRRGGPGRGRNSGRSIAGVRCPCPLRLPAVGDLRARLPRD